METESPIVRELTNRIDEVKTYIAAVFKPPHRDKTKFILFANYRSGSTLLASLLNSHPSIFCDDEILLRFIHPSGFGKILLPRQYIQGRVDFSRGNTAYGFDLKIDQISKVNIHRLHGPLHNFMDALRAENWKFIHLQRQNLFRQALSNRLANQRQLWHKTEAAATKAVHIEPEDLLRELVYFEHLTNLENDLIVDLPHIKLTYERDLLETHSHQATASRVFDYLGLNPVPVKTNLRKVSAFNLAEDVLNFAEIERFFKTTRYAHFLEA